MIVVNEFIILIFDKFCKWIIWSDFNMINKFFEKGSLQRIYYALLLSNLKSAPKHWLDGGSSKEHPCNVWF
jgi:hypothetical protein